MEKRTKWKLFSKDKSKSPTDGPGSSPPQDLSSGSRLDVPDANSSEATSSLTTQGSSNASATLTTPSSNNTSNPEYVNGDTRNGMAASGPGGRAQDPAAQDNPTIKLTGPNGTTVVQEPRVGAAELPAASTPGSEHQVASGHTETGLRPAPLAIPPRPPKEAIDPAPRKSSETPGRRIIPPREPFTSPPAPGGYDSIATPPVPERSTNRHGAPQNFSYPGRNDSPPDNYFHEAPKEPRSTLESLKTAAVGLHGVGETLRGTLNDSVDRRFGSSQQARDKNQAAIDAGRFEIEQRRLYQPYRPEDGRQAEDQQERALEQQEHLQPGSATAPADAADRASWGTFGAPDRDAGASSRLGKLFGKGTPSGSQGSVDSSTAQVEAPKERTRLRKRSSSVLGVVQE
ncbi:hypothetical protein UCDDA912_g03639 [Diaporthe ampelina]|uniref:Uncharacterized protein n=1 Tax=Diaporthe ampelina TaxID=1214573 RepID=A0A0G2FQY1_9PEZI|nr:hypothetical protein UCDDA912_g03639 [Diaporthe ampelina]